MPTANKTSKDRATGNAPKGVDPAQPVAPKAIVSIGASAGGFSAIHEFLGVMPADSGIAFVVIQHFDATYKSQSAELFGHRTAMRVTEAVEGVPVEPNHVYTIPSDRDVSISDGRLHLHGIEKNPGAHLNLHLPIDLFLQSLAEDQQERAIAIILSGTGCDGTQGIKAIEANGGLVIAQQPESAQYDGMPRSAISTGLVDRVLPIMQIPQVLIDYTNRRQHLISAGDEALSATVPADTMNVIFALIRQQRGVDFSCYKHQMLLRRIQRRMVLERTESLDAYLELLRTQPSEVDALCKDLLIGVTAFFRDAEAWQQLETSVIAPLIARTKDGEPIRAWVAGTSTGEEAYSLAMLLLDKTAQAGKHCPINVFATDTNNNALTVARTGLYPASIATQIPPTYLQRYFTSTRDQQYQVAKSLRDAVVFGQHNLMTDPPYSRVDIVTCRNLLIYLDPDAQKKVVLLAHFALRPDGYLFLGSAETVGRLDDFFKPLSQKWRIYRRVGATPYKQLDVKFAAKSLQYTTPTVTRPRPRATASAADIAQRILVDEFAPASALVNSKYEVIYFGGPSEHFLAQPPGAPTRDLLLLARPGLRSRLRKALRQAAVSGARVEVSNARVKRGNLFESVKLTVVPAANTDEFGPLLLVVFEDEIATPPIEHVEGLDGGDESVWVKHLEDELQMTKDDLQSSIEHLESTNEDLKVSNEEVVSINEELQSVNEELESSREELQSLNEELNAVNQQLQSKVAELEAVNNDVNNLIASSDIAALCLDRNYRIKWFTPALCAVFNVTNSDIGRAISDFSSQLLGENLTKESEQVVSKLQPLQKELQSQQGRWYLRRILPYHIDDQGVEGVIVTLTDITESKRAAEQALAERERLLASLENRVHQRTTQLRALTFELTKSEELERRSIAQDLHDGLGQNLALAKIKLDSLRPVVLATPAEAALATVIKLIDQSNQSLRSLAAQLCPPMLYDLGLVPALRWLADEMLRDFGLHISLSEDDQEKPLDQSVRVIVFRAIRELLINVAKHADVTSVTVDISVFVTPSAAIKSDKAWLKIIVRDNGKGFDPHEFIASTHTGFGLLSVRERLNYIGGYAEINSAPGAGTVAMLTVPLETAKNNQGA